MTYEYNCIKCKESVEIIKPISELHRLEKCKKCGTKLIRVFSSVGVKTGDGFKGGSSK